MKYPHLANFESSLRGQEVIFPCYAILCKEEWRREEAIRLLLNALLPLEGKTELIRREGREGEEIRRELENRDLFSPHRLLWIQRAEMLEQQTCQQVEKYLSLSGSSSNLRLLFSLTQRHSTLFQLVETKGLVIELPDLKPWEREQECIAWLGKRAEENGKQVSPATRHALVQRVGSDGGLLRQEWEKLMVYCYSKAEVTIEDVKAVVPHPPELSVWKLGEAVFRRQTVRAIRLMRGLIGEGEGLLSLIRSLRIQFQTEYQVALCLAQGEGERRVTEIFPYMKGKILQQHLQYIEEYGLHALRRGILLLDEAEARFKRATGEERLLAEWLMGQLTFIPDTISPLLKQGVA